MDTVRVEEAYSERDETIDAKGNVTEIEIPYFVFNVDDESKALSAVKRYAGMSDDEAEVILKGCIWEED